MFNVIQETLEAEAALEAVEAGEVVAGEVSEAAFPKDEAASAADEVEEIEEGVVSVHC